MRRSFLLGLLATPLVLLRPAQATETRTRRRAPHHPAQQQRRAPQAVQSPRDVASGQATGVVSPRDAASGLPTGRR